MHSQSKIVFTQDVPGEREWINSRFPGYTNLETEFGGKWPGPIPSEQGLVLWEVPPDSTLDISNCALNKVLSVYQPTNDFVSQYWCDTDDLIHTLNFNSPPKSSTAEVITFGRSGTIFLESILFNKELCNYRRVLGWNKLDPKLTNYFFRHRDHDQEFYKFAENTRPDLFFVYRSNWWNWVLSTSISKRYNYYHYNDNVDWNSLAPFDITSDDLSSLADTVHTIWSGMCHFRTHFPSLNIYLFEFSDLIKHQSLTEHKKIKYKKSDLISNYEEAKNLFDCEYAAKFSNWQANALSHLTKMNATTLTNFDLLLK